MQSWEIREGDALERLAEMPDESVQCCVTSPPYFGLRDYGTGEWEGGEDDCDHLASNFDRGVLIDASGRSDGGGASVATADKRRTPFRDKCGKCGARRVDRQIGLERSPDEFVARLVEVFREVRRVLRSDGTFWLNIGDSYNAHPGGAGDRGGRAMNALQGTNDQPVYLAGHGLGRVKSCKPKDLLGIPWLLAFALRADGWYLRSDVIWAKPNPMPESVTDRPTSAHEHVFLLAKSARYFYDADAIREDAIHAGQTVTLGPKSLSRGQATGRGISASGNGLADSVVVAPGRNKRNVWEVATQPFSWRQNARQVRVEPDDADDDTTRITSRDCPVHGDRRPQSTARDGGRVDGEASRTERTDARLAQESLDGLASTGQNPEPSPAGESSDSPSRERAPAATPHSTQSRRTDLDPATSPSCMPSDERPGRNDDTSTPPESAAQRGSTDASSSAPDGSDDHPSVQTAGGKSRTSSCTCRFYRLEETDHFATFPPKLIEPCILAGSAEGDVILDPFAGAGTTGLVALRHDRSFIGIELNPSYAEMARERIRQDAPLLNTPAELAA